MSEANPLSGATAHLEPGHPATADFTARSFSDELSCVAGGIQTPDMLCTSDCLLVAGEREGRWNEQYKLSLLPSSRSSIVYRISGLIYGNDLRQSSTKRMTVYISVASGNAQWSAARSFERCPAITPRLLSCSDMYLSLSYSCLIHYK